ncbi:MAG: SAM-dependent methyltransferase [Cyanobacteriota bacterium]|nr:SAM-dependent methyltransferase [Cyanobacteriota bacterium]
MPEPFSARVRARFAAGAAAYAGGSPLQRAVAWRLVRMLKPLPIPEGPCADLGAGSGAVVQAAAELRPDLLQRSPLEIDLSAPLLARNPLGGRQLIWNLNRGLPEGLEQAALLSSSFALQWLDDPPGQLARWCSSLRSGGVLALALPTSGSFPQWHQAAVGSGVPCTALPLPSSESLIRIASDQLRILHRQRLRFSRPGRGLALLRQMRAIGADATTSASLSGSELRRLLRHWPRGPTTWEVLVLLGIRR